MNLWKVGVWKVGVWKVGVWKHDATPTSAPTPYGMGIIWAIYESPDIFAITPTATALQSIAIR